MKAVATWAPILGLAAIGSTLCAWLWGRTGDILLDFGNELYISWQLSSGKVLYRDVACEFGPLSPTFNGLIMRMFGLALNVILTTNLVILIAVSAMLYLLLRRIGGAVGAFVATGFFLAVFALSSPTRTSNYNFLTPYRHNITHGFLLCVATIWCIDWFCRGGSIKAVVAGGLLSGLAFLTKPEMFFACVITFWLGMAGAMWARRDRRIVRIAAVGLMGMLVPAAWAFLRYSRVLPAVQALEAISGGWQNLRKPFVISVPFYKNQLGTSDLRYGLSRMIVYAGFYTTVAAFLALTALWGGKAFRRRRVPATFAGLLCGAGIGWAIWVAGNHFDSFWPDVARGFPVLGVLAVVAAGVGLARARTEGHRSAVLYWTLAVLSLVLLAKIFFNVRIYHYGFVLAAPCGMLAVVALMTFLPAWVDRHGGCGLIAQLGGLGVLIPIVIQQVVLTQNILAERTLIVPLVPGGEAYVAPSEAPAVAAMQWLDQVPGTVAVLPDAGGINYATAHASSVPYTVLNPMVLAMDGESSVMQAFARHPPDFVVLMTFDEGAFGAHWLGNDYGVGLFQWIRERYRPVRLFPKGIHPVEIFALERRASPR